MAILGQSAKLNVRQSVFCCLIAKLNVRQMYHLYGIYSMLLLMEKINFNLGPNTFNLLFWGMSCDY